MMLTKARSGPWSNAQLLRERAALVEERSSSGIERARGGWFGFPALRTRAQPLDEKIHSFLRGPLKAASTVGAQSTPS